VIDVPDETQSRFSGLAVAPAGATGAVLRGVLRDPGWRAVFVATNQEALAAAGAERFDVVVTGAATCGKDDVELLRQVRKLYPHTRVIILTTNSTPADLIAAIREHAFSYFTLPCPPEEFAASLNAAMEAPNWDDGIELVSAKPEWIRVFARCDVETAERLVRFIAEIGSALPCDERKAVAMAARELFLNAMEHGGNFDPQKHIEVGYLRTSRAVCCRIRDPGGGFSLDEIPHAAISNPQADPLRHVAYRDEHGLRPGGYGVLLAGQLVDELLYNEQGNEVILVKYLEPGHARAPAPPV
jgi:anti-sigma regulatory factor (Ser/Thr protein kinase)/CheY-like chemotaxis protein